MNRAVIKAIDDLSICSKKKVVWLLFVSKGKILEFRSKYVKALVSLEKGILQY